MRRPLLLLAVVASACSSGRQRAPALDDQDAALLTVAAAIEPTPTPAGLSVATYNVNANGAGLDETAMHVRALDADVVVLQETSERWADVLREKLGRVYPHMAFRPWREPWGSLAVLSRFPFRDAGLLAPVDGPFPAWLVTVSAPAGEIHVLNVHLFPPVRWARTLGWMRAYAESQLRHEKELSGFMSRLDLTPDIVAGDFNEDTLGRAVRWLQGRGYRPVLEARTPTWRWSTKYGELRWPLDHIFVTSNWKVLDSRVVEGGASDHIPVVATLARTAPEPAATQARPGARPR